MTDTKDYKVDVALDVDAGVWIVDKSDIPGLFLEAADPVDLLKEIRLAAPILIRDNLLKGGEVPPFNLIYSVRGIPLQAPKP